MAANTVKYDQKNDTILGDRIMLFVEDASTSDPAESPDVTTLYPIAFGTSCNCEINADTIDTSNKMGGNWKNTMVGQLGWSVSSESLMSKTSGHMSFNTLKKIMARRMPITVVIGKIADTDAEFAAAAEAGYTMEASDVQYVKGSAVITALSMTAGGGGEIATCSITLQGDGPISDADESAA